MQASSYHLVTLIRFLSFIINSSDLLASDEACHNSHILSRWQRVGTYTNYSSPFVFFVFTPTKYQSFTHPKLKKHSTLPICCQVTTQTTSSSPIYLNRNIHPLKNMSRRKTPKDSPGPVLRTEQITMPSLPPI